MSYTSAIANFSNDADGDQILNSQENNIGTDPRVVTTPVEVYNAMSNRLSLVQAQEVMIFVLEAKLLLLLTGAQLLIWILIKVAIL